jgi:hypothetical protein
MRTYKQTNKFTGSASALMMVINHFRPHFILNRENEFQIWHETAALPVRASCIYAMALVAHKHDIKTRVIVGDTGYDYPNYRFKKYQLKEIKDAQFTCNIFHKKAKKAGIDIIKKEITIGDVINYLKKKKVLIVRLNTALLNKTKATSKMIPVYVYRNKRFILNNPSTGRQMIVREELMKECFKTIKTKCYRDNRMLVFG